MFEYYCKIMSNNEKGEFKMIKKILSLITSFVIIFALVGCDSDTPIESENTVTTTEEKQTTKEKRTTKEEIETTGEVATDKNTDSSVTTSYQETTKQPLHEVATTRQPTTTRQPVATTQSVTTTQVVTTQAVTTQAPTTATQLRIIGNINSHKYHTHDCGHLPNVENRIYFNSVEEAEAAGMTICGFCNR